MNIESSWVVLLAICGGIITIIGALEKIFVTGKALGSPYVELKRRITAIEMRLDKHDEYLDSDKRRIELLERELAVIMKSQFAILNHLCGSKDNTEQVESALAELQNYLTMKGVKL